jgi:hypothetical protein
MITQKQQPSVGRKQQHQLSSEAVQAVAKDVKPYEQLLIKCRDDWIHHLAQALAFSLLVALVNISILLLSLFDVTLGRLDTKTQHILTGDLESIIPSPLSSSVREVINKAFDTLSHSSGITVFLIILLAILLGSFLFSLMESCFDVIYHLPHADHHPGFGRTHVYLLPLACHSARQHSGKQPDLSTVEHCREHHHLIDFVPGHLRAGPASTHKVSDAWSSYS